MPLMVLFSTSSVCPTVSSWVTAALRSSSTLTAFVARVLISSSTLVMPSSMEDVQVLGRYALPSIRLPEPVGG